MVFFSAASGTASHANGVTQIVGSLLQVEQPVTQTELHKCVFSAATGTASQTKGVTQMLFFLLQVEQPATQTA